MGLSVCERETDREAKLIGPVCERERETERKTKLIWSVCV